MEFLYNQMMMVLLVVAKYVTGLFIFSSRCNVHVAHLSITVVYEFIIHPIEFSTCSSASSMVVVLIFAVNLS